MKKISLACIAASFILLPFFYLSFSLESLVLGHGFIGFPNGMLLVLLIQLIGALAIVITLGLPSYFLLKRINHLSIFTISIVGLTIPLIISIVVELNANYSGYSAGENYYGTYRSTFTDGQRDFWGWIKFTETLITTSVFGIISANMFHYVYRRSNA